MAKAPPNHPRRCTGHRTDGSGRCDAYAMHGQTVCEAHGGMAPQNRKAGARNVAIEKARRMADKAGTDIHPIAHLLDALHRSYQLVLVWGEMAADLDDLAAEEAHANDTIRGELGYREADDEESRSELIVYSHDRLLALNHSAMAAIHPFQLQYERAIDRHSRIAKLCVDAGVEERQIRLREAEVDLAHRAFEAMLTELKLTAAKKQEARQAYARHLRRPGTVQHGTRRRARPTRAGN